MYSSTIGAYQEIQSGTTVFPFFEANDNLFNFNQLFLADLKARSERCGQTDVSFCLKGPVELMHSANGFIRSVH